MTEEEQTVLNLLRDEEVAQAKVRAFYKRKLDEALAAVAVRGCTHPVEAHYKFNWEWDNGYGRQSMCEGIRCRICDEQNYWPALHPWPVGSKR